MRKRISSTTHASFFSDLDTGLMTIEITGTGAIPEFPIVPIVLGASFAGLIIVTGYGTRRLR